MKKTFEQPELMVVRMNNNDIVTISTMSISNGTVDVQLGADRFRDDWDAGY